MRPKPEPEPVQDVRTEILDPRRNDLGSLGAAMLAAAKKGVK